MRLGVGLLVAAVAFAGARAARSAANAMTGPSAGPTKPFVPSPAAAPFVSLGYREVAADLLYIRMIGHFIGEDSSGDGVADLADAIITLDPRFYRAYDHGANAMTLAKHGVDQSVYLRAIGILEAGMKQYPQDWRMPYLAGQIYTQDLQTEDETQKRAWNERGILLVESAIRKPGAPSSAARWAATMRSKLGQRERAIAGLREMLLITQDSSARERLLKSLSEVAERDADALATEVYEERMKFENQWHAERRTLPATMYLLIGARITPGFEMTDLATGGRDLYVDDTEPLEPLE